MSDSFRTPRGQIGLLTKADGTPQWLYALEGRGGAAYAILWVLIDRPGKTLVYVGTESGGKWVTVADLARAVPDNVAGERLDALRLQGGQTYTAPLQSFTVYKDDKTGPLGFQQAEVLFDPFAFGAPTLIAQIGREPERAENPADGVRVTPSEAATALSIPLTGAAAAFASADSLPTAPVAPTAPPGFGDVGPKTPPVGKLSSSTAITALVLIAVAGALLVATQKAR